MMDSQESHRSIKNPNPSNQRNPEYIQNKQNIFSFLQKEQKSSSSSSSPPPFFSENGLSQDIIQVTQAEPDISLEVFYALYKTLWPQIESQSDVSFKDAWTKFIGGSLFKGTLCPPERLITERRIRDMKKLLSQEGGENQVFHDLDQAVSSISYLKEKIENYQGQIFQKEEIIASLNLVQAFYQNYRDKVKILVQDILEKERNNVLHTSESEALEDLLEPKAIMMSDIFAHHWAFRISRNQAQKLLSLDAYGRHLKSNPSDPASHRVIALPEKTSEQPLVFFKANGNPPIQPEKEFMLYSLYRHLQIPVPETALLVLTDVFEANPDYFYAVQASEAVLGESSLKACQDQETIFDHEAYVAQTIGAFLTNPSDGSFKNFKYSPEYKTLISIDNDLVFKPEITGKDERKVVNVKSILYLLPQIDLPIPESIKTFFTTLDPHLTTLLWLRDFSQKNQEYQLLFARLAFQRTRCIYQNLLPQSQVPSLESCLQKKVQVDSELHSDSFNPQILLSKDLLTGFIGKLQAIEKILLTNRSANAQTLFEEISPALAKYYRKLRFEFTDPGEALEALWGNKKNEIDYSYIFSLLDHEEFKDLSSNKKEENLIPETFFKEYKDLLISGETPLDNFLRRHNERKKKNTLSLHLALKELQFLIQESFTSSQSMREIVEFCHSLSKIIDNKPYLIKEITSLLSNLPQPELKWLLMLEKFFLRPDQFVPKDLITSSVEVLGALMKKRTFLLTESENQYIFDKHGNIKKNASLTGRSRVTFFPQKTPEFYLKQYPEWPGYEFASTLFMRLLGIAHLPYQDLLIIKNYPVLLTQKAYGNPVIRLWKNSKTFNNLDAFHTGLQIICAMLINPEDGKEDNFILTPDGKYLIPIDNDHCFLPSTLQKEGSVWNAFTVNTALQTKTILFCLDEMYMEVPLEVRQHVLSLDFDLLLPQWMTELDKIENKFNNLVDQNQRNKFLEQGTVMRILFYKQFIENIHWKAHKIQDILKTTSQATPFDLLKAVEPFAARCYEDSFKQGQDLHSRFTAATKNLYKKTDVDGSRMSILNTRTMMEIINVSEKDLQNDAMFQRMGPIDALELLSQLIEERSKKLTMEQDMLYELDEKKQEKKWINLFGDSPGETALKAFFAGPKEGLVLRGSKLITSSKLTELFAQASNKGMRIRFLSLPECPVLTDKEIRILAEECPNIEYLNVSGCLKLKRLITRKGEWALLSRLEAKGCAKLEKFASYSPMKILQIQTHQQIEIFVEKSTFDVLSIKSETHKFDFSLKKGEGFRIKFLSNHFSSDDFGKDILAGSTWNRLKYCFQEFKITIGMFLFSSGEDLAIFVHELNCQKLESVKIENLQTMIMLKLISLKKLDFSSSEIHDEGLEVLTRGNWPFLKILNLSATTITARGIRAFVNQSNWPQLKHIDLSANEIYDEGLEIFVQANWPLLERLELKSTKITAGGIEIMRKRSNWPELEHLDLSENEICDEGLETLVQGNWPLLEILNLKSTKITTIGVRVIRNRSYWPKLKHLYLFENEINDEGLEILAQGNWPSLESLILANTSVTKKGLLKLALNANWPILKSIKMQSNLIEDFDKDVSFLRAKNLLPPHQSQLKHLNLSSDKITQNEIEIIIQCKLPQLKDLNLSSQEINDEGLGILVQGNWPLLESLDLKSTKITVVGVEVIIKRSNWPQLKYLVLSENEINDEGLETFAQGNWPSLETLVLSNTGVTKKGLLKLLLNGKWPILKSIRMQSDIIQDFEKDVSFLRVNNLSSPDQSQRQHLNLSSGKITQKELELIIQCRLSQLKDLNLSSQEIKNEGLEIFVQGNWPLLESLNLKSTKITAVGIEIIIKRSNWPQLTHLDLSSNEICDEGLEFLVQGDWPLLEILNLESTKITAVGVEVIRKGSNWPQLEHLNLSENEINTEGLEILIQGNWPLLEGLNLYATKITAVGVEIMIKMSNWPQLKYLVLCENEINDEGLENLVQGNWPLLEGLYLKSTKITTIGIEVIIKSSNWPELKYLDLSENEINDEGLEILIQGNWPSLETLDLTNTGVTKKGLFKLLLNANWPNLNEIELSDEDSSGKSLWTLKYNFVPKKWDQLDRLDLGESEITQNEIELMVERSNWPQLKHLDLSGNEVNDEGLEILVQGQWPLLEVLELKSAKITAIGIGVVIKRSNWPQLKHLDLSSNEIYDGGLEILAQGNWPSLETLDLTNTGVTKKGLLKLALHANWPNLNEIRLSYEDSSGNSLWTLKNYLAPKKWDQLDQLDLSKSQITQNEIELMIERSNWPQLNHLDLSENEISAEGLEILVQKNWSLLKVLILKSTKMTTAGIEVITKKSNWPQLEHLDLSDNKLNEDAFEILAQGNWPSLESLDLKFTQITATGVEVLINRSKWPLLKFFHLSKNEINDDGLEKLAQANWPLLTSLELEDTKITYRGVEALVKRSNWQQLKYLYLSNNEIDNIGIEILTQGNWPLLEILTLENTKITDVGVEALVKGSNWQQLNYLVLSGNEITDKGFEILIHGNWPFLGTLNLERTGVTKKAWVNLRQHTNWRKLQQLTLPDFWDFPAVNLVEIFIKQDSSNMERLVLNSQNITSEHIETILNKYKYPRLKHLNLSDNDVSLEEISLIDCPLLEELHIRNIKMTLKGIETIVNQSKWSQRMRHMNISHNEVYDEGLLELANQEWPLLEELNLANTRITSQGIDILVNKIRIPNLKKLDISENSILDEGVKTLISGDWPLFEHLIYYDTQVTPEGNIALLENFKWPNLSYLEHSMKGSFYSLNEDLDQWLPSKFILAMASVSYKKERSDKQSILVSVLDKNWLSSKEIYLSINHNGLNKKIMMLPREKIDQFNTLNLSHDLSLIQFIVEQSNPKILDLSETSLSDENKLQIFLLKNFSSLKYLCLANTNITANGIESLLRTLDCPNLKNLDISLNRIEEKGLEILTSMKLQQLEDLDLSEIGITNKGLEVLVNGSDWSNLKKLAIAKNLIKDEGFEILVSGKWKLLEDLNFAETGITARGLAILINKSSWLNLKKLVISANEIQDEGLEILASGNWQLLEDLNLFKIGITSKGIKTLVDKSNWPNLKRLLVSDNQILDEGLEILASGKWKLLEDLHLAKTGITAKGIQTLTSQSDWPNLKKLAIDGNEILDEGLETLVSGKWKLLEDLNLAKTGITSKGIQDLTSQSDWPNLKILVIAQNPIEDQGLEILSNGKWPLLEKLYLQKLKVTSEGFEKMLETSDWPNLKTLDISENFWILGRRLTVLSSKWPLLECLYANNSAISPFQVENFVGKSSLPNLKEICLEEKVFDDQKKVDTLHKLISEKWPNIRIIEDYKHFVVSQKMSEAFGGIKISKKDVQKSDESSISSPRSQSDISSITS